MWLYLRDVKVWNFKYIDTTQGTERPDKRRKWSRMESTWKIKNQKSLFLQPEFRIEFAKYILIFKWKQLILN
jgi:hypothetical protein